MRRNQRSFLRSRYENATLIFVGCSVHYWVSCAINKGGFFEIAFLSSSSSSALAYILPHFDALTRGDSCVLGVHLSKVC